MLNKLKELANKDLTEDTLFDEAFGSLQVISLLVMLEKDYGKTVSIDDLASIVTIGDVMRLA